MLDVHIAVSADTPAEWVSQCLDSVHNAARLTSYPVYVFVVDGIPGHIGKTRANGYALGNSLYKTYVDDDDYVMPEMFSCLEAAMQKNPAAVFTGETLLQNGMFTKSPGRHHLAVYRSDVLREFPFESWRACGDVATQYIAESHPDGTIGIPMYHYVHRVYRESKARKLRKQYRDELREAKWQIY